MDKQLLTYVLWVILIAVNLGVFNYFKENIRGYFNGFYKAFIASWFVALLFSLAFDNITGLVNNLAYSLPAPLVITFITYSILYMKKNK